MARLRTTITFIIAMLCAVSCGQWSDPTSPEQLAFYENSQYGLYAGDLTITYDESRHQKAVNSSKRTWRIQSDSQDEVLSIHCEGDLNFLSIASCDIITICNGIRSRMSLDMTVVKYNTGHVWLWNDERKTGLIVPHDI